MEKNNDSSWALKKQPDIQEQKRISSKINVSNIISCILLQRGIDSFDKAKSFFRPSLKDLHDPFLMADMSLAVKRIQEALSNSENIMILGDYDVDGTTSVALLYSFLKNYTPSLSYYIPDRYKEGYGVSDKSIEVAQTTNIQLIISLDCGIKAHDNIQKAKDKGIDFIVCDHHNPSTTLPNATAIINPKRHDCKYPYKELCGCGIAFKLTQALTKTLKKTNNSIGEYLDLVAVAIAADIVPITGENRVLAFFGLKKLVNNPRLGLKALLPKETLNFNISDVVFKIAPVINATGRISHALEAVKLFLEENENEAQNRANSMIALNNKRRDIEKIVTEEAISILKNNKEGNTFCNVIFAPHWHKGVIGIVASRVIETFYKPTIVFTESNGMIVGSARSIKGFDIHRAIEQCAEVIENYGGHTYAAGLAISKKYYQNFKTKFEQIVSQTIDKTLLKPTIEVDTAIALSEITPSLLEILKQLGPFGPGNMTPLFFSENLYDTGYAKCMGDKYQHLKCTITSTENKNIYYEAIGFGLGDKYHLVEGGKRVKAIFSIEDNSWNDQKKIQLRLRDISS